MAELEMRLFQNLWTDGTGEKTPLHRASETKLTQDVSRRT